MIRKDDPPKHFVSPGNPATEVAMIPKTLILFDAKNNDNTLIDAETNTAHKDQQMELTKGIIKVKVVHDPLPYNQPLKRKPLKKT